MDIIIQSIQGQDTSNQGFKKIETEIEGPSGIYLVEIRTQGGKSTSIKILKE